MSVGLYAHALRVARPRQLRARATRAWTRRRFPGRPAAAAFAPVRALEELWRSPAFAVADEVAGGDEVTLLGRTVPFPPRDWSLPGEPRLRRFHLHYGEEVLGWARRGDVARARAALRAWIDANPPRRGDAWHPYPLSTRVGSWVAALTLVPELAEAAVVESLQQQLRYLVRNVEDDVLGNHVIRNARALVLGGVALGDDRALRRGLDVLRREVPEQVLPDGGHYERSPVYHRVVMRDLVEVRDAAGAEWLGQPLRAMAAFAAATTRPDRTPLAFNDAPAELAPPLPLPDPATGVTAFPDTGIVVVRAGDLWLALDAGEPAPAYLPPHAHADSLTLEIWHRGRPVVVDPGTYTYEPGADRSWFRGTRAHSTIALDGRDQFRVWGAFRAGPFPRTELLRADADAVEAAVHWRNGVVHVRRVTWTEREVRIEDELKGAGRHAVSSRLQLAGDAAIEPLGPLAVRRVEGWRSERLYERQPAAAVELEGEAALPLSIGWLVRLAG